MYYVYPDTSDNKKFISNLPSLQVLTLARILGISLNLYVPGNTIKF